MSEQLMHFDPATGEERPYPSHAAQWREWHGAMAWMFNPWTGSRRHASDVGSDPYGLLIVPDGEPLKATPEPATVAVDAGRGPYGGRLTGDSAAQDPTTAPEPATVVEGWSGWSTQRPGKMPKLYGTEDIARLNWHPDEGEDLVQLVEIRRLLAGGE